jgi:hypothetical protein
MQRLHLVVVCVIVVAGSFALFVGDGEAHVADNPAVGDPERPADPAEAMKW